MATIKGLLEAASMMPVSVSTGSETRPSTTAKVLWIGGTSKPLHMAEGDVWFRIVTGSATAPEFLTTVLNTLTQGAAFSQALLLNGTTPMTFAVTGGTLPAGLSLHTGTGVISGTPSASGSYSFTVQATNSIGSDSQTFTGTVTSSAVAPDITTTSLNSLTQGTAFSQTLAVTGTTPLTWTISAGTLPAGLSMNSATGIITGTPTGSGAYSFSVQATNTAGSDTQAYSGTIASTGTAPTITTTTLDALQAGFSFSQTLNRTGSTPMTWGVSAGTIPAGLTINSSTGVISGTPTTAGAYSFTVQAVNSFGNDTQAYSGTVAAGAGANVFSIFGTSTPFTLTSFSDADTGAWLSHQYYTTSPGLTAGSKIIGARLYVPEGSAHIGTFWYAALRRQTTGYYPNLGSLPYSDYDSNGSKKVGANLVAGWNEILFTLEYDVPPVGGSWTIGVQIGDGTRYLHDSTYSTAATKNLDGKDFWLAEVAGADAKRCWYKDTATTARSYGIDTMLRIPA